MSNEMNDIAAKSLGSANSYAVYTDKFDPTLLNPMPRSIARDHWGITGQEFVGFDVWHCHEATFMLNNGCPVAGTLKFVYPASSEFMVESKSAKLYLNSFDMCKMGATLAEAIAAYEKQIEQDLSACVRAPVRVKFHSSIDWENDARPNVLEGYDNIENMNPEIRDIVFTDYNGNGAYVSLIPGATGSTAFYTNALRSRCRHTKQKDTGLAAVKHAPYGMNARLDPVGMFKQIVSLREVNEFHEFCAEKLFVELKKNISDADDASVTLLYSRRGSLDINPVRATKVEFIDQNLINPDVLTEKVQGQ